MHIYRFTRQGPEKKPTFVMREYKDGRVVTTQHLDGKETFQLIWTLFLQGFKELDTGDPYLYVMHKEVA